MKTIRFAHLADTHLCREGKSAFLDIAVRDNFEKAIDYFCAMNDKLDFVVVTGDIINDNDLEDYRYAKGFIDRMQEKLGSPIFLTIGNHDDRGYFFEGYLEEEPQSAYYYSRDINGLRLIVLDSKDNDVDGEIGEEQLLWLKQQLEEPAECGTVLAFHHPTAMSEFGLGESSLRDTSALYDIIWGTDVIGVLTGHTHRSNQNIIMDNILSLTADSMAYSLVVNGDDVKMIERFGFNMVTILNQTMHNNTVTFGSEKVLAQISLKKIMSMVGQIKTTTESLKEFETLLKGA
ncbi:MAG: metallophosphoesterase [Peptococcaceae bacterium]|nr:metallophosphoesterase [Peptococcaceae bacterium]